MASSAELADRVVRGEVLVAEVEGLLHGYAVVDRTFFGRPFIQLLFVSERHRRHGVGRELVEAVVHRAHERVFTSTNLSNFPMQGLLSRSGWHPCGLIHGLDENDPEVFYFRDTDT
jgi:GNAT superfamily N-acetyltransferase